MNTRRFYTDTTDTGTSATTVTITGDEFFHLKQVNRARPGDEIEAIDGRGNLFYGEIRDMKSQYAIIDIKNTLFREKPPLKLILAPSLLKQRPMSILIEKLTEMGVDEIQPLIFQRTDEKYNPSRLGKWQKVAIQSLKVNKRLWQTQIHPPLKLDCWLTTLTESHSAGHSATKILLDIGGRPGLMHTSSPAPLPLIAVIGPPGDMTGEERDLLMENGFISCNISDAVLKTETAAISIAAILKEFLNRQEQQNRNAA